jgi:hypothetical protein
MARVGLGCLGVVTELTLQAVPVQKLQEKTFVATAKEVAANHAKWLRSNKHMRYMWLPYTDSVVVVQVGGGCVFEQCQVMAYITLLQRPVAKQVLLG